MKRIFLLVLTVCFSLYADAQVHVTVKVDSFPMVKGELKMYLAGDFNGWNPADPKWELRAAVGGYTIFKEVPAGNINFKVTRGSWESVECDSTGHGITNRTYTINKDTTVVLNIQGWQDKLKVQRKKPNLTAHMHIMDENFDMPQLGKKRRVWLYLPADYETSKRKYPVIYMHDGQNLFDASAAGYGEWGVDETLDSLPVSKQCIIVGIDHGENARLSEYSPYDSEYAKAKGDAYLDFLVSNLKPYIDTHYRTKTDAQYTAIAGSSMGGLISFYAALKYPGVFGKAGVFSPAFWVNPGIFTFTQQTAVNKNTAFYFSCGDQEGGAMVTDMQKMYNIIKTQSKLAAQSPVIVLKGEKHNEKQWRTSFPHFYQWLGW